MILNSATFADLSPEKLQQTWAEFKSKPVGELPANKSAEIVALIEHNPRFREPKRVRCIVRREFCHEEASPAGHRNVTSHPGDELLLWPWEATAWSRYVEVVPAAAPAPVS